MNSIENLKYEPLTKKNIESVYEMCQNNVLIISQPIQTFKTATLESDLFDSELSVVAFDDNRNVIAFFMCVLRRPFFASVIRKTHRKVAVLKFFVVKKECRYKGLGTIIYKMIEGRLKKSKKKCFRMKFEVMSSMPDYWLPGLDPRHTEAYFFLKKQGFKKGTERNNLYIDLNTISDNHPDDEIKGFKISRAKQEEKEILAPLKFMPKGYRLGFWPEEIRLSFQNNPITTFVAKDPKTKSIIGWASHSAHFPGSFGPTGVQSNLQSKGIGSNLLNWCLWDLKKMGLEKATIMWVTGDTVYFYLKSKGARISEFYWTMRKRI